MTNAQEIFAVLYSVLFGAMLSGLGGLQPFPWGFPAETNAALRGKLPYRLVVSVLCFNVLPIYLFARGFEILGGAAAPIDFWRIFWIGLASLSVFAPYRFFTFLIVLFRNNKTLSLYDATEYSSLGGLKNIRMSAFGHLFGVLVYLGLGALIFLV